MKTRKDPLLTNQELIKRFRKSICKSLDSKIPEQSTKKKSWMKFLNSHVINNTRPWA